MFNIRNITFIEIFKKIFVNVTNNWKIQIYSKKLINSFQMNPYCLFDDFFWGFVYKFSVLLLCKEYFFDFLNIVDFFQIFFLYREVLKF